MTIVEITNLSLVGCDALSIGATVTLVTSLFWGRSQALVVMPLLRIC